MARFTQEQLTLMSRPASDTEETKLQNAASMLKRALNNSNIVDSSKYEVFGQGSYANNTNIRQNSDIDINVCYTGGFYYRIPEGTNKEDYGLGAPISYSFTEFKNHIEQMLVAFYGRSEVVRNNKCITVKGNTSRIQVDVVPTWQHRRYDSKVNKNYVEGVKLFPDDNPYSEVVNYPKQHIANGITKNDSTSRRFKRLTRIFKNIRVRMEDEGYHSNENVTSFLLECLAFNVPTNTYTKQGNSDWNNLLRDAILYLYNATKDKTTECDEWGEVSELLYLLRGDRKWSRQDVNSYMYQMWNYLQLGD